MERINGRGAKFRERNLDLDPAPGRQTAREFSQRNRFGEASRKFGDLQAFSSIREDNQGKVGGRNRLGSVTPEVKISADKLRQAIAKIDDVHLSFPAASRL